MKLPKFELVSFSLCPYVQRARTILLEKNIEHEVKYIDLSEPPEWFYDISPLEKVPVLLVDAKPLFESMVICEYLDEITPGSLHPADPFSKAENRAWIEFGNDILASTYQLFTTDDEKRYKHLGSILEDRFDTLEETLEDTMGEGEYFNGDDFSIIDAVYAPVFRFHQALNIYENNGFFDNKAKMKSWSDNLLQRASVINSVPETYASEFEASLRGKDSIFSGKMN